MATWTSEYLHQFADYIENKTNLFDLGDLGYPWYLASKEGFFFNLGHVVQSPRKEEEKIIRHKDFLKKVSVLNEEFDYIFFVKSKIRRKDSGRNVLFSDLFDYLDEHNKKYLIVEESVGNGFDLMYLDSPRYSKTLPYEPLFAELGHLVNDVSVKANAQMQQNINQLFKSNHPETNQEKEFHELLHNDYLKRLWVIPHILFRQALCMNWKAKAVFGSMGSHMTMGFNNPFSVIEVAHAYYGNHRIMPPPSSARVYESLRKNYNLLSYFVLALSATKELYPEEPIAFDENRFHYGMPEFRAHEFKEENLQHLSSKYNFNSGPVIFFATAYTHDPAAIQNMLTSFVSEFPGCTILLRPHPMQGHDYPIAEEYDNIHYVENENKNDLLKLSDIVLTNAGSLVSEALVFTDNILMIMGKEESSERYSRELNEQYPWAKAIPQHDTEKYVETIKEMLQSNGKKEAKEPVDVQNEIDRLFKRLDSDI